MSQIQTKEEQEGVSVPQVAVLSRNQVTLLRSNGELVTSPAQGAGALFGGEPLLCCFAPRLQHVTYPPDLKFLDILELFAFVRPAKFCVPTPHGVAAALGGAVPETAEEEAVSLLDAMTELLYELKNDPFKTQADPLLIAQVMGQRGEGWAWTPYVFEALGQVYDPKAIPDTKQAMRVWKQLPEWAETAPPMPPAHHAVTGAEAVERLETLVKTDRTHIEERLVQKEYARHMAELFQPVSEKGMPHVVLAEAGTGVGKTLGYLAPASVWAEKNDGSVWISTYTKNLQRQIDQELYRLYPDETLRTAKTAVRKGRENYLCLLNLEEASAAALTARDPQQAVAAGLMARWAVATRDGDLTGADFPGWLGTLLGFQRSSGLADRRGECVYAACDHYHRCYIERAARKSPHARIVIANHALVMSNAVLSGSSDLLPQRYIFDEGHHLFDAADGAFAVHLTAQEGKDLRRWILGPEGGRKGRARGLRKRLEDLVKGDQSAEAALQAAEQAARGLPAAGWTKRLRNDLVDGALEKLFQAVYHQVQARATGRTGPYSLETGIFPVNEAVVTCARDAQECLKNIQTPLTRLVRFMRLRLENDTEGLLSSDERRRLDSLSSSLERRAHHLLAGWIAVLEMIMQGHGIDGFVEWMEIERIDGQAVDVGLYRHWIDPMQPFASTMKQSAHGIGITSATLRDSGLEEEESWRRAKAATGAESLTPAPVTFMAASPFDYASHSKVFIIDDVRKDDPWQVAAAYEALFRASGGGALGLFTAVQRLRAVYERIYPSLADQKINLYAQHMDEMDAGTLVDIFRDEEESCLLGTDAIRDGVDVPGRSLRLIVFDRVPWPRPTILHKARRDAFGRKAYDDMLTSLKLKQAFGRLIRRKDDRGVFVLLDPMLPSRLHSAFPEGTSILKCGLSEAVKEVKTFLHDTY
ncbi:MAG: ATP-dependent DNA helicase [Rhodospirillales bacterium]|nr:ATP-dependent DNA helicase [Rhodospirillales bacterium]